MRRITRALELLGNAAVAGALLGFRIRESHANIGGE